MKIKWIFLSPYTGRTRDCAFQRLLQFCLNKSDCKDTLDLEVYKYNVVNLKKKKKLIYYK